MLDRPAEAAREDSPVSLSALSFPPRVSWSRASVSRASLSRVRLSRVSVPRVCAPQREFLTSLCCAPLASLRCAPAPLFLFFQFSDDAFLFLSGPFNSLSITPFFRAQVRPAQHGAALFQLIQVLRALPSYEPATQCPVLTKRITLPNFPPTSVLPHVRY